MTLRACLLLCAVATGLLFCPATTHAQVLHGRVVTASSDSSLPGATVLVYSGSSTIVRALATDSLGRFEIELPGAGTYALLVRHTAFPDGPSSQITVEGGRSYHVLIRIGDVVSLEPLEVNVQSIPRTPLAAANRRITENRHFGIGTHMTRDEIVRSGRVGIGDLIVSVDPTRLRTATQLPTMEPIGRGRYAPVGGAHSITRLTVLNAGSWCPLRIYVDGVHVDGGVDNVGLSAPEVGAVEVYTGPHSHGGYMDPAGCGVALIWTHRQDSSGDPGAQRPAATRWEQWAAVGAALALLGILFQGWF